MPGTDAAMCCESGGGAVDVACGLAGDGTAAAPLAVATAAPQEAWSWPCDIAQESTVRCDPGTGQLWAEPSYGAWSASITVDLIVNGSPIGPTGGPVHATTPGAAFIGLLWPPHAVSACRRYSTLWNIDESVDISWTSDAAFRLGFFVSKDGGPDEFLATSGIITPIGAPSRRILSGALPGNLAPRPANQQMWLHAEPAIHVISGQVQINLWIGRSASIQVSDAGP